MHFWIDKRSRVCSFNGRYLEPSSLFGYAGNHRILCSGLYPKSMVTPVHRFQSIESAVSNGTRYNRAPNYHSRLNSPQSQAQTPTVHYNDSNSNIRTVGRSLEILSSGSNQSATPRSINRASSKCSCGIWMILATTITFYFALKFYFYESLSIEMILCVVLVFFLLYGTFAAYCEFIKVRPSAVTNNITTTTDTAVNTHSTVEQNSIQSSQTQVDVAARPVTMDELPPPPYHIAVMLSPHNGVETIQIVRDSPPPSYEKAVT